MDLSKVKPMPDKVVLLQDPVERKLNGLWIQESAWDHSYRGTVVAVGPGPDLVPGDRVWFGIARAKGAAEIYKVDGKTYILESAEHVWAREIRPGPGPRPWPGPGCNGV
jgi:co-chaperonin GroES (HSP10)